MVVMVQYRHRKSKNAIREKRKNQVITVEHRKALSESMKRGYEDGSIKKSMLGKHHTEEHKEYMRKLYTGDYVEEQKKQISIANKGRKHSPGMGRISEIKRKRQAKKLNKK
jgi:hypothetical protein